MELCGSFVLLLSPLRRPGLRLSNPFKLRGGHALAGGSDGVGRSGAEGDRGGKGRASEKREAYGASCKHIWHRVQGNTGRRVTQPVPPGEQTPAFNAGPTLYCLGAMGQVGLCLAFILFQMEILAAVASRLS